MGWRLFMEDKGDVRNGNGYGNNKLSSEMEEKKKVESSLYDTHSDGSDDNKPVPISVMENEFINSRRYIRRKIVKGKLSCDQCKTPFQSMIPFFIVRRDKDETVLCHPCSYLKMGVTVEEFYKRKRAEGEQLQTMKQQKMERSKANQVAIKLQEFLQPYCKDEFCNIAGSIRRLKPDVKDIELVVLPKTVAQQDGFFDTKQVRSAEFINAVKKIGKIIKGSPEDGRYVQIELAEGLNLDLFIPQEHDYFRQYVVRTGSSEYSARTVAKGWSNKGWCGTEDGLRLIDECEAKKDKSGKITKWVCLSENPTIPPHWRSEKEFFEWLSIPYLEPENRK